VGVDVDEARGDQAAPCVDLFAARRQTRPAINAATTRVAIVAVTVMASHRNAHPNDDRHHGSGRSGSRARIRDHTSSEYESSRSGTSGATTSWSVSAIER